MAEVSNSSTPIVYGKIFRRYVQPNLKRTHVRIPVTYGTPDNPQRVNVFLTEGEVIDLISALKDAVEELHKKGG